jgi:hypothetical protein
MTAPGSGVPLKAKSKEKTNMQKGEGIQTSTHGEQEPLEVVNKTIRMALAVTLPHAISVSMFAKLPPETRGI